MAKPLDTTELPASRRTRESKYPWDEWFDGRVWEITPDDYNGISLEAFCSGTYSAAKRFDKKVSLRRNAETGVVHLKAVDAS